MKPGVDLMLFCINFLPETESSGRKLSLYILVKKLLLFYVSMIQCKDVLLHVLAAICYRQMATFLMKDYRNIKSS